MIQTSHLGPALAGVWTLKGIKPGPSERQARNLPQSHQCPVKDLQYVKTVLYKYFIYYIFKKYSYKVNVLSYLILLALEVIELRLSYCTPGWKWGQQSVQ